MADFADEWGPRLADAIREAAPSGARDNSFVPRDMRKKSLRDSIFHQRQIAAGDAQILIKSDVPQARFVIGGTAPHDIVPVIAKALHWEGVAGSFFARRVHHPGTTANPFPGRGVATIHDELAAALRQAVRQNVQVAA